MGLGARVPWPFSTGLTAIPFPPSLPLIQRLNTKKTAWATHMDARGRLGRASRALFSLHRPSILSKWLRHRYSTVQQCTTAHLWSVKKRNEEPSRWLIRRPLLCFPIALSMLHFRYGYNMLTIARPKLYSILLSRIPAYKILFNKRVVFASQTHEGVKVRCEDGSTISGDILVAADGGASPIRTAMYEEIRKRCKKVPHPSDYSIPKLDQRVTVGVTEPLSTKQFPILDSKNCELILMMPKESNCMVRATLFRATLIVVFFFSRYISHSWWETRCGSQARSFLTQLVSLFLPAI